MLSLARVTRDTYEEALADARSAVAFHVETFGPEVLDDEDGPILEVFVAETAVAVRAVPAGRAASSGSCSA